MKLKEIIEFIDDRIPPGLALDFDDIGFSREYDLNQNIDSIKIYMDLIPEDDNHGESTLIITHHPPLFKPNTPTYTVHSNWDIIKGGANEALAEVLGLEIIDYFDKSTNIGRICRGMNSMQLKERILDNFDSVRVVNNLYKKINNIGIISGFGLKNPEYIKLAYDEGLDVLISGDLCQETAILAKNLGITLIDLGHHESEVPGLYKLAELLNELDIPVEVIDKKPIEKL